MNGVNKAIVVGNLGADPEVRYTQAGDAVCTLSVATSETWKDKASGEQREKTQWHRAVLWRKLAEIAVQYLHKGDKIYLEGQIEYRKWQKDGVDQYTTEIKVRDMQMLGGRSGSNGAGGDSSTTPRQPRRADHQAPTAARADFDDDIQF